MRAVHPTWAGLKMGQRGWGRAWLVTAPGGWGLPIPGRPLSPPSLGPSTRTVRAVAVQPLGTAGQLVKQSEGKGWVLPKHACFPGEAEQPALQRQREGWWQRGNEEVAAEEGVTLLRPAELSRRLGDLEKKVRVSSSKRLFPSAPSLSLAEIRAARLI